MGEVESGDEHVEEEASILSICSWFICTGTGTGTHGMHLLLLPLGVNHVGAQYSSISGSNSQQFNPAVDFNVVTGESEPFPWRTRY